MGVNVSIKTGQGIAVLRKRKADAGNGGGGRAQDSILQAQVDDPMPNGYSQQWKVIEASIVSTLISLRIIDPKFTGSLTFHFNQGGISDFDKSEKCLKKKLFSARDSENCG